MNRTPIVRHHLTVGGAVHISVRLLLIVWNTFESGKRVMLHHHLSGGGADMKNEVKVYHPIAGKFDPCTPITEKTFVVPPQLFLEYQPMELPQYSTKEALKSGTLWPELFSSYEP